MPRKRHPRGRRPMEHFAKMLRVTMETPAWGALTTVAQALYPWLKLEWHGPDANNNGQIRLSVRQASERLGVSLNTAARGFHDLQAKGFIVQTEGACLGTTGKAKSPAYEITELGRPHDARAQGRMLYKDWRQGHDFPVHKATANNPFGANGKTKAHRNDEDGTVIKMKTKPKTSSLK